MNTAKLNLITNSKQIAEKTLISDMVIRLTFTFISSKGNKYFGQMLKFAKSKEMLLENCSVPEPNDEIVVDNLVFTVSTRVFYFNDKRVMLNVELSSKHKLNIETLINHYEWIFSGRVTRGNKEVLVNLDRFLALYSNKRSSTLELDLGIENEDEEDSA